MAAIAQKSGPETSAPKAVDDVGKQRDAASGRHGRRDQPEERHRGNQDQHLAGDRRHGIGEQHQAGAAKDHQHDGKVVEEVIDDQGRHAVNQRNAFSQQRHLGGFAQQRAGKGEEAHRLAAKPRRERLHEGKAPMLRRDRDAHRDGAQHVPQAVDGDDEKEAKADAAQRRKDWLDANLANDIKTSSKAPSTNATACSQAIERFAVDGLATDGESVVSISARSSRERSHLLFCADQRAGSRLPL